MLNFDKLSYWEKETYINHTDYLIIGSGIVGLSTAIHLKQRKPDKKVTVLERGYLPTGASTKNAGFSCIGSPSELLDDLSKSSESAVFATVEKRWKGLHYLRNLLGDENIGYYEFGSHELFDENSPVYQKCLGQLDYLNENLEKITEIPAVFKPAKTICSDSKFNQFSQAISHAAEGQINTGKMMFSLLALAQQEGVIILNGIEAKSLDENILYTNYGEIKFERLAICTNGFASKLLPNEDVEPARAQVLVTSPIDDLKFKGIFHYDEGYYYFRNIGNRVLFGGGRNLNFDGERTTEAETTDQIINKLKSDLAERILPENDFTIEHTWAGIMGVGKTKAPIIKQLNENSFCAIRLGGMGVAIGSITGKELADLMLSR